ncbi:Asp23/Gls24 family envelope stress response protein [Nocardia miyunensis]|uniref:Asp23/Gls24 family envelope stress response protein n=1 Tax=Nocardia miyunensis TaxID=282684 RepID=UPI000B12E5A4|nr:Asp23/Gls24 family envelope stress response protein [Nocardia miyunensis]
MTSIVGGVPAVSSPAATAVILRDAPEVTDPGAVGTIAAEAAREITGVGADVQVRARIVRGAAVLSMRLPIRYPMPVWQVSSACRTHVLERLRNRLDLSVRRLEIQMCELVEL